MTMAYSNGNPDLQGGGLAVLILYSVIEWISLLLPTGCFKSVKNKN
jgi:hypothetical protein